MMGKAKNILRRKWRCILLFVAGILLLGASSVSVQPPAPDASGKTSALVGTWYRRTFVYTFTDSGTFQAVHLRGHEIVRGRYAWLRLGTHDCVTLWGMGGDSTNVEVVLIGDVTDSTAVIALGTPFVRDGSGKGLGGQWKHMDPFRRIGWTFGFDQVKYIDAIYHPFNGEEQAVESRAGEYSRDGAIEPGSFTVRFGGGKDAIILPVVYRDMMYLFDLSSGKSYFRRVIPPPPAAADTMAVR